MQRNNATANKIRTHSHTSQSNWYTPVNRNLQTHPYDYIKGEFHHIIWRQESW